MEKLVHIVEWVLKRQKRRIFFRNFFHMNTNAFIKLCKQDNLLGYLYEKFHPRYKVNKKIIELNLTNICNLTCYNCASSCKQAPSSESTSLAQIERFVHESCQLQWKWDLIKLYGGEPVLHPHFFDVVKILKKYKDIYPNCAFQILTNGVGKKVNENLSKVPSWIGILNSFSMKKPESGAMRFESYNVAPIDLKKYRNTDFSKGCFRIEECGICLSYSGYYVCAPGFHIDRVFGFDIGIKRLREVTHTRFKKQLKILCKYCGLYKMPLDLITEEKISPTWQEVYKRYEIKKPDLSLYGE